jgi:hypothetical protein
MHTTFEIRSVATLAFYELLLIIYDIGVAEPSSSASYLGVASKQSINCCSASNQIV